MVSEAPSISCSMTCCSMILRLQGDQRESVCRLEGAGPGAGLGGGAVTHSTGASLDHSGSAESAAASELGTIAQGLRWGLPCVERPLTGNRAPVPSVDLPAFGKAEGCLPSSLRLSEPLAQGGAGGRPCGRKPVWFLEFSSQISSNAYFAKEKGRLGFRSGRHFREQLIL